MRAGVAGDEVDQRALDRLGEGLGQAGRQGHAERVPHPGGVLGRGVALLARHRALDGPGGGDQLVQPLGGRAVAAGVGLLPGQRPERPEDVGQLVGVAGPATVGQPLQVELEVGQHVRVDQLPQLLGPEQVPQQVPVEGQRRGPALGQRGVALVHVDRDPAEQQRLGEGRGLAGLDRRPPARLGSAGRRAPRAGRAGRTRRSGTPGWSPAGWGSPGSGRRPAAGRPPAGAAATAGVRWSGRRRGSSRARADASRKREAKRAVFGSWAMTSSSISSGSIRSCSTGRSSTASGRRRTMPSSLHMQLDLEPPLLGQPVLEGHGPRGVDPGAERA